MLTSGSNGPCQAIRLAADVNMACDLKSLEVEDSYVIIRTA
jgi:hypothetical protein